MNIFKTKHTAEIIFRSGQTTTISFSSYEYAKAFYEKFYTEIGLATNNKNHMWLMYWADPCNNTWTHIDVLEVSFISFVGFDVSDKIDTENKTLAVVRNINDS